jgi:hypothetical protein
MDCIRLNGCGLTTRRVEQRAHHAPAERTVSFFILEFEMEVQMLHPEIYKFQYTRGQGQQRTYDVVLNVVQLESGIFAYESWVHFAHEFKGNGLVFPLIARTAADAEAEARGRIEDNIENLAGVAE